MHQMWFGGRAPPGPAGGGYSAPPDPVAALKLLVPSALDARLRRLETERSGSSFFLFDHCSCVCHVDINKY